MPDAIPWTEAEPTRFADEQTRMNELAPGMHWDEANLRWDGHLPIWPFSRPAPPELDEFLDGRQFRAQVQYSPAFPMVAPRIVPIDPDPDASTRSRHDWHVNGDGSLCLLQSASDWDGSGSAADLVPKAAAWFLEYLLMERRIVESMTEVGIANDDCRDHLLRAPPKAPT